MSTIADRVEARLRAEWPGTHIARRGVYAAPEVREGGVTEAFIQLAARIAQEEVDADGRRALEGAERALGLR